MPAPLAKVTRFCMERKCKYCRVEMWGKKRRLSLRSYYCTEALCCGNGQREVRVNGMCNVRGFYRLNNNLNKQKERKKKTWWLAWNHFHGNVSNRCTYVSNLSKCKWVKSIMAFMYYGIFYSIYGVFILFDRDRIGVIALS